MKLMVKQYFLLLVLSISLVFSGCGFDFDEIAVSYDINLSSQDDDKSYEVNISEESREEIDKYPNLSKDYEDHIFLKYKETGDCLKLTGKTLLTVVFVNDNKSDWTSEEINNFKSEIQTKTQAYLSEAQEYNVELEFVFDYLNCTIEGEMDRDVPTEWAETCLEELGLPKGKELSKALIEENDVDCTATFFCVDYDGRAFARVSTDFEYAVIYNDTDAFCHEMSHIFGAVDYYVPVEAKEKAREHFDESIMISSATIQVDSLTAYLIGWTDEVSEDMKGFLDDTDWITKEYLSKAEEENRITGFATIPYNDGIYTGDLVDGIAHGNGKLIYSDGSVYEGGWNNGHFHGKGKFTWESGQSYEGDFVDGKRTGFGKYIWSDGDIYEGNFVDGMKDGYGKLTWSSGDVYEGYWKDGSRNGKGKMTWSNGNIYDGDWLNDARTGKGKFLWAQGDRYEGDFVDGKRTGKGKYIWAEGDVYEGDFYENKFHGKGKMTWTSGNTYEGEYNNDKRHGYGIYTWSNGDEYKGWFANGKFHGEGTYTYANGDVVKGYWDNGEYKG